MANDYFDNSDPGQRFQPGTTAESEAVDEKFDRVATGFGGVSEDTGRALKLPAEAGVSQEIAASALQRRSKVVGFDAEGKLALLTGFTWRENWTPDTDYFVNDVFVDAATGNWYRVTTRHTSGAVFSTENLTLALDVDALNQLKADTQALKEQAATSAQIATDKADQAAADRQQTGLDRTTTSQDRTAAAQSAQVASENAQKTAADRNQTGLDRAATKQHRDEAKQFRDEARQTVLGDVAITDLQPGTLTDEKDYASVDASGALVKRNVSSDIIEQLSGSSRLGRYNTTVRRINISFGDTPFSLYSIDVQKYQGVYIDVEDVSTTINLELFNLAQTPAFQSIEEDEYQSSFPPGNVAIGSTVFMIEVRTGVSININNNVIWPGDSAPELGENRSVIALTISGNGSTILGSIGHTS
ncbi:hypothetical protein [Halomonas sp. WWR20]